MRSVFNHTGTHLRLIPMPMYHPSGRMFIGNDNSHKNQSFLLRLPTQFSLDNKTLNPPADSNMPNSCTDTAAPDAAPEIYTERNMEAPGSDHEGIISLDANYSMKVFGFPPKIRLMVWDFLLPGRRVLNVRAECTDGRKSGRLWFQGRPRQPILSQICQESRTFVLGRGSFISKKGDNGGFWWSSEHDVFLIDRCCSLPPLSSSLKAIDGLNLIQNIAVDSFQAAAIRWIKQEPKGVKRGMLTDYEELASTRRLLSWGRVGGCTPHNQHPILTFFKHCSRFTVHFSQPFHNHPNDGSPCDVLGQCGLTLDIPAKDMKTGVHCMEEFLTKWVYRRGGMENDGGQCRWKWKPSTILGHPDSVETCRSPSFRDSGDLITTRWGIPYYENAWDACPTRDQYTGRNLNPNVLPFNIWG